MFKLMQVYTVIENKVSNLYLRFLGDQLNLENSTLCLGNKRFSCLVNKDIPLNINAVKEDSCLHNTPPQKQRDLLIYKTTWQTKSIFESKTCHKLQYLCVFEHFKEKITD